MDKELTITVKDIIKGIKERRVIFYTGKEAEKIDYLAEGKDVVCQIGENWFFLPPLVSSEKLEDIPVEELASRILEVLIHPYENGIGDTEASYYKCVILDI